jgi:4-amino-4-deoxy-L-arabinose transferase-like glycosyltransferase
MQFRNGEHLRTLLPILALFTGLCLLFIALIPPFEGPDGPEHVAYLAWLADGQGFPPQGEAAWETPLRQEAGQPPLYYLIASLPLRLLRGHEPQAIYRPNPHFPSNAAGTVPDNKNVAIYYPTSTLQGEWLALLLARLVSVTFGWLVIVSVFGLVRELWPEQRGTAVTAALFTAVTPQLIFISSVISNDVAVAALSSVTLWLLARLLRLGVTGPRTFGLGLVWGLALLSKSSALALGLPLVVGLAARQIQQAGRKIAPGPLVRTFAGLGVAVLLVAGWWYGRVWILYGSPLGTAVHCYAPWAYCDQPALRPDALAQWREVFDSYWAAFGWGNVKFPGWAYLLPAGLGLAAVAGWLLDWPKRGEGNGRLSQIQLTVLLLTIFVIALSLELWMRQVTAPHGRLLFPALGAITALLVMGWHKLWPPLASVGIGTMLVFSLGSAVLLYPAYHPPAPLTEAAVATLDTPIGWQYGTLAELVAVSPAQPSTAAGATLPVAVCWRTLSQSTTDYTVLIQLIGPDNQVVASRRTYPGLGLNPTSVWPIGQVFCDTIGVQIPTDLAQTLRYQVEVGFIDQASGARLPVVDAQGSPVSAAFASAVRLEATTSEATAVPPGTDPIQLVSFETADSWSKTSPISLTLNWWAAEPLVQDYTVFIHLRDPATGEQVLEADGPPLNGWYPTSWWQPTERVRDLHTFTLPDDVIPGSYTLFVGWYDPATGQRLGDEFELTTIEVIP